MFCVRKSNTFSFISKLVGKKYRKIKNLVDKKYRKLRRNQTREPGTTNQTGRGCFEMRLKLRSLRAHNVFLFAYRNA